ncbi:MAG TPA: hypothetical protein VFN10_04235 [Thermoanaerobaculia bacterium]|nr:hypothetical protein [Thermoanaerobaculia bacterium]
MPRVSLLLALLITTPLFAATAVKIPNAAAREAAFADEPLEHWLDVAPAGVGQNLLRAAAEHASRNKVEAARDDLHRLLAMKDLSTETKLNALAALRELGEPQKGTDILGVVVETVHDNAVETLVAYADHTTRFIRQDGRVLFANNSEVTELVERFFFTASHLATATPKPLLQRRVDRIEPSEIAEFRIYLLTPQGTLLRVVTPGEEGDPVAGLAIKSATDLLRGIYQTTTP